MIVKNSTLTAAVDPNLVALLQATARNSARSLLAAYDITDNSTGTPAANLVAVNTQNAKVAASGSNLSPRAGFNTAIGKVNNAIAVLATALNSQVLAKLGLTQLSGFDGNVAVAGTVPALDKALTASDGSGNAAMLRAEANAAIVRARNNLSCLVRAYNIGAVAVGVATLSDLTGGTVRTSHWRPDDNPQLMAAGVTAATSVLSANLATSDLATDVAVDAALLALADNIATLASKIETVLLNNTTLTTKIPIILVP